MSDAIQIWSIVKCGVFMCIYFSHGSVEVILTDFPLLHLSPTYISPLMFRCVVLTFTRTYSCWTALRPWKTKMSTISLYNFPPLFHTPHPLLVGIHGEGPAVRFFTPDQVILYYFLCFLGRQESWDDWRSSSAAKSNSRVYLWTSVGVTPTPPFTGDSY